MRITGKVRVLRRVPHRSSAGNHGVKPNALTMRTKSAKRKSHARRFHGSHEEEDREYMPTELPTSHADGGKNTVE
jgi:hypothetical protein